MLAAELCLPEYPPQTTFSDAFVAAYAQRRSARTPPRRAGGTDGVNQFDGSGSEDYRGCIRDGRIDIRLHQRPGLCVLFRWDSTFHRLPDMEECRRRVEPAPGASGVDRAGSNDTLVAADPRDRDTSRLPSEQRPDHVLCVPDP